MGFFILKFVSILKHRLLILILLCAWHFGMSQYRKVLSIKKATEKIVLDGIISEKDWSVADSASDFVEHFPTDSILSPATTWTKLSYDNKFLYVAAKCYDFSKSKYVISSLRRDHGFNGNDAYGIYFDTYDDKTNAIAFGVNAYGAQRDGLFSNGGGQSANTVWDAAWESKTKIYEDHYVIEMAIPFKWLRYSNAKDQWGINIVRNNLKINELSSWNKIPLNFNVSSLAFTGLLKWDAPPKKAGQNISIIPYINFGTKRDYALDTANKRFKSVFNFGGDAKIALTSSFNMDLTINPDFSQVEVDRQQINLTRFSIQFPEQRNFFIENQDLFSSFGFRQIRPFFSRRIGIENGNLIPIYGGIRLNGKVSNKTRVGLLNMQTAAVNSLNLQSQNFLVASYQRQIFKRSNINAIFVNKQAFSNKTELIANQFNRIGGLEFFYQAPNNSLIAKGTALQSFSPTKFGDALTHMSFIRYQKPQFEIEWNHEYVGKNVIAEAGFINRNNVFNRFTGALERFAYWRFEEVAQFWHFSEKKNLLKHGPGLYLDRYYDSQFRITDNLYRFNYILNFKSTAFLEAQLRMNYTKLKYSTADPFGGFTVLDSGGYNYTSINVTGSTNSRNIFSLGYGAEYGDYFNGTKLSLKGDVNYRIQPFANLSFNYSLDRLTTIKNTENSIHLFGSKIDLTFTKAIFFTTFLQYNTLANNFNINARFQWRYKPLSDLFLVYTDNYNTPNIAIKNRAFILKWVYWFTV